MTRLAAAAIVVASMLMAGCSTTSSGSRGSRAPSGADGPPLPGSGAPDVRDVPDAEPKLEPIRSGGPNKPYEVLGQSYTPMTSDEPLVQKGLASWYGRRFHGRRTASGETYNMYAMTAAHKTMPIPSYARVRNPANGREVIVRVNDRGPFSRDRVIDLSYAAAVRLGVQNGVAPVEVERITYEEIRAGLTGRGPTVAAAAAPTPSGSPPASPPPTPPTPSLPSAPSSPPLSPLPMAAVELSPAAAATPSLPTASGAPPVVGATAPRPAPAGDAVAPAELVASATSTPPTASAALLPVREATKTERAHTAAASGFWLQLGAFGQGKGAYTFQERLTQELDWLSPLLTVFSEGGLFRLQAGPYATRDQAREAAEKIRAALALVPLIVERR
ncbi:septal ring lytic transglycosylase RlpA family protein [Ideonella sp. DXS29W]|uniref:Endolytic peptidoglycan transglycosylase RlpA n=1 Tax=Ideonella lacteola TaxID=2984193 RepID=A0ABU9BKQ8_9BURK